MAEAPPRLEVGSQRVVHRTFTLEEVQEFGRLTGDQGVHHLVPDAKGRIMVQGLLVASLPTKVGGEMNFIARELHFAFHRPVWTSISVRCEVTLTHVEEGLKGTRLESQWRCTDPEGNLLMDGHARGVVLKAPPTST